MNSDFPNSQESGYDACVWFPPAVRESFHAVMKAKRRKQHKKLDYLCKKFQKKFPAYAGYYLEVLAIDRKDWGRLEEALDLLHKAEESMILIPPAPSLGENIIDVLLELEKPEDAQTALKKWASLFPTNLHILKAGSRVLMKLGRWKEAIQLMEKLNEVKPEAFFYYHIGDSYLALGDFQKMLKEYQKGLELDPTSDTLWLACIFFSHYSPYCSADDIRSFIFDWYKTRCAELPNTLPEVLERERNPKKKLRIGLFSPGFNMHPVGWMTSHSLWFLAKLDDCELWFYSLNNGLNKIDPVRDRFKEAAKKWFDVSKSSGEELYAHVILDHLDIAVDMTGCGEGCVLPLFVKRIAPIQVKWVGCLIDTSGVPNMDYLLSDRYETPEGCDADYTEHIIRMPCSYISYDPIEAGDTERIPDDPDIGAIRFASFNNLFKVNDVIIEVWSKILHALPNSTILLKTHQLKHKEAKERIKESFAKNGIAPERVEIEGPSDYSTLLQTYRKVDIALDTWPYTGGLTTLEALWMGVPVITTAGPTFAGRHALSHLCNVGLENLVAKDFDDYVNLALKLAQDRKLLQDLRVLLPYSVLTSPVVQHHQLAADLHTVFRSMWERYCQNLPPIAMHFDQPTSIPDIFKAVNPRTTEVARFQGSRP